MELWINRLNERLSPCSDASGSVRSGLVAADCKKSRDAKTLADAGWPLTSHRPCRMYSPPRSPLRDVKGSFPHPRPMPREKRSDGPGTMSEGA
jgi:hypothetical protein